MTECGTQAMLVLLQTWTRDYSDEKVHSQSLLCLTDWLFTPNDRCWLQVMVISQWTQYLQLLAEYVKDNGFSCVS